MKNIQYKPIIIEGKPVPAVRQTQKGKYVKDNAKKYNAYKEGVAWIMKTHWQPLVSKYALLKVKIYCKPAKSTGTYPLNYGDWDNFYKTFADAVQTSGLISNDSKILGPGPGSRKYLSDSNKEYAEIQLIPIDG